MARTAERAKSIQMEAWAWKAIVEILIEHGWNVLAGEIRDKLDEAK